MTLTATASREIAKPLAGGIFVVFWAAAIVLWVLVGAFTDPATRGFVADAGIVLASIGLAAPFLPSTRSLGIALGLGAIAIGLAALFGYLEVTVGVYFIRAFVPYLALMAPLFKFLNGFKIWS
jgi:hypothetical protein